MANGTLLFFFFALLTIPLVLECGDLCRVLPWLCILSSLSTAMGYHMPIYTHSCTKTGADCI